MSNWIKQKPIEEFNNPCLNCPPKPQIMSIYSPLAIGFGNVCVTRDSEYIWSGDDEHVWLRRFENKAAKEPDHDWRVTIHGPLYDCVYQRHGPKEWVLIERGEGFA